MTVTVDPGPMDAVTRDAIDALVLARRRVASVRRLVATDLPTGPQRSHLDDALDSVTVALRHLAVTMERPREVAAAMVALDRRSRDETDRRTDRGVDRHRWLQTPAADPVVARRDLSMLVAHASSPAAVADRWARLSRGRRTALLLAHGPIVANLDGIPVEVRDRAHRATIAAEVARLTRSAPEPPGFLVVPGNDVVGPAFRRESAERIARLQHLTSADLVLTLDLAGDGRAVVAVGDPTTAAHVATVVPGIGTTLRDTNRLLADARALQDRATAAGGGAVATIAWLGYDTPPGPVEAAVGLLVNDPDAALQATTAIVAEGAVGPLARHAAAIRVDNPDVHHTLIGHSYGSVVALRAVGLGRDIPADVDDVVVLGSPGAGAGVDRADLDWPHGVGLWHASAPGDPVPHLPLLGPDAGALGAVGLPQGPGNHGHVRYLAPGTVGLSAVALVVAGTNGCPVPPAQRPDTTGRARVATAW